ncbi:hypothetical protein NUACC26_005860 [Scytonema sp. NUACC26]
MCEYTAINRVTDMISSESNSLSLDIYRPLRVLFLNKVAYRISQNERGINTPKSLDILGDSTFCQVYSYRIMK